MAKHGGTVEHKQVSLQIKSMADGGHGSAQLVVAVFGNIDRASEVILPGAFSGSLTTFVKDGFFTVAHDWSRLPVATITSATETTKGLLLDVAFHSTAEAQECRTVMRERFERGKSVKSSIGYEVLEDSEDAGVRYLKGLSLYEASFVLVPCNTETEAVAIKGAARKSATLSTAEWMAVYRQYVAANRLIDDTLARSY